MCKLHLDTDIGGDIDDLCALAMVLNWPEDLINFLHDPLACAVALGWDGGVVIREIPIRKFWLNMVARG